MPAWSPDDRRYVIVWLDMPRRLAQRRIRHPGLHRLTRFVRSMADYYVKPAREPTEQRLDPHAKKVEHLRRPSDVRSYLRRFAAGA